LSGAAGGNLVLDDEVAAVFTQQVLAIMVHPALRRRAPRDQVDGNTRRIESAPAQTLLGRDRLDDQPGADRLRVVADDPRRSTLRFCSQPTHS